MPVDSRTPCRELTTIGAAVALAGTLPRRGASTDHFLLIAHGPLSVGAVAASTSARGIPFLFHILPIVLVGAAAATYVNF